MKLTEPIIFRSALRSEAKLIQIFQQAMALETENLQLNPEILEKGVTAVFENKGLGEYHVCEVNSEVIGSLLLTYEWSDWRNGTVWWIQSLYLKPEFRGLGIFSKMYSYLQQMAHDQKEVRGIRLYVDRTNDHAHKVYKKLGMNDAHYNLFEWMKNFEQN